MERITLAHGSGGQATADLVRGVFLKRLGNSFLASLSDSAVLPEGPGFSNGRLAMTTDGFVVTPLFFPGGDIGRLAVMGTVNDLAVAGARPSYITAAFIVEEGLPLADLEKVVDSMAYAASEAGVLVVAGDTKVVERGACDCLYIVTAGIGYIPPGVTLGPRRVKPGDRLVLSGPVGLHGVAVLSRREGTSFETSVKSDCASVAGLVVRAIEVLGDRVRWMRDPTRGGLATVVCELAEDTGLAVVLDEVRVPIPGAVAGACELLGLDPLYLANEGKVVIVVAGDAADEAVCLLKEAGQEEAVVVGSVTDGRETLGLLETGAYLRTAFGGTRILDKQIGEQLPRIC